MKTSLFGKLFLVLPLILFIDYIIMALLGCVTCLFGLGEDYYCGAYCVAGKIILILSAVFFGYLIYPEIKQYKKSHRNVKAAEEKKHL